MKKKDLIFLFIGIQAAATSIIFIKASTIEPITLAAYRLIIAAVFLTPIFFRDIKKKSAHFNRFQLKKSILASLFLSIHFILWLTGGRMTLAVNASLIINLTAIVMPFLLYYFAKEKINRTEIIATLIIILGLLILGIFDFSMDPQYFWGDIICFAGMIFLTLYLLMAKISDNTSSVWLYVVPIYFISGVFCFIVALVLENPLQLYSPTEYLIALGLGIIPTVIGHSSLNFAMSNMRGQIVGILNSFQFILAGFWAFFLFKESPNSSFYFVSPLILGGIIFVIITKKHKNFQSSS